MSNWLRRLLLGFALGALAAPLASCVVYLSPRCDDTVQDGNETDVDCGGSCGTPCKVGMGCRANADCINQYCVSGTCQPLPCVNGVRDGQETDVDCGGPTCRGCAMGGACNADSDCLNHRCEGGKCFVLRELTFAQPVSYGTSEKPYYLVVADLNGDKHQDVAVAIEYADEVMTFLGKGDGTLTAAGHFPCGHYPTGLATADFNHDRIPDLVTGNYALGEVASVSVLLGKGDGTMLPFKDYPTGEKYETATVAVGDFNGDGNPDLVTPNPTGGNLSFFTGNKDGTFQPVVNTPTDAHSAPYSVVTGDYNGDGKIDVVYADLLTIPFLKGVAMRLGLGDGTFQPTTGFNGRGSPALSFLAADVDGDGALDLISANRGSSDVSVLLGNGDGTLQDAIVYPLDPVGLQPYSVSIGDLNGDGAPDLVTPNFRNDTVTVLLGSGGGRFRPPLLVGNTGSFPYSSGIADFNEDGKADVVVCNAAASTVYVYLNTSAR